jgi:hypothetical protein
MLRVELFLGNVPAATDTHATIEAGSNTYTVALRVVGGDEKGTQYLGL